MRLSKLNMRKIQLNDVSANYSAQDILMKLGELYQFESGIFGYGNIWSKLQSNIEKIIIEELDKADCIQVTFPELQPKSLWERSGRWDVYTEKNDIMFTLKNNLGEYGLAPTAEECATVFGANRLTSYKSLPVIYYQIGEKFRKEIRTRGYLFRPRVFTMMDAYSFDRSSEEMHKSFQKMHDVYLNIFQRIGIKVVPVVSDGGTIGGSISEEFQAFTDLGEDTILYQEDKNIGINKEVLNFEEKDIFLHAFGTTNLKDLKEYHSLELGNNFELGTKYSDAMKLYYIDESGNQKPYYMGCYGIGIGRFIACVLENNLVKKGDKIQGFVIPYQIAPYKVQIIYQANHQKEAEMLYSYLLDHHVPAILDDRDDLTIGNRIKDVSVLGTPKMIILGNQFDGVHYAIEDMKTSQVTTVTTDTILSVLQK